VPENISLSDAEIITDGVSLPNDLRNALIAVSVEQHTLLPGMFTITLNDPKQEVLEGSHFDLAKQIEISAVEPDASGRLQRETLIKGEITALEPEFVAKGQAQLVVRGFDKSHRAFRETKAVAYLNVKDSDLASQIAGSAGLSTQIDTTSVVYDHVYQDNQTDLAFLTERAWRIGFECYVADGKLHFRQPEAGQSETATVKWGENLVSFHPRLSLAEQVDEVSVHGWDPEKMEAIVGTASRSNLKPSANGASDASKASSFGSGLDVIVDQPVVSQSEATKMAEARFNERTGAFIVADGKAINAPAIRAGKVVKLEGLGTKFDGKYLVTAATHTFDVEGWRVNFEVRGLRTGLIGDALGQDRPLKRWPGVVTAVVTNTDDPNDWGRVKVKFPWITNDAESWWARLVGAGAGPDAGMFLVPDVGDEVLVAFEHGDFNRPIVLGGLWNGKHAIPPEGASGSQGERPLVREWRSRTGHFMAMYDNADDKIQIETSDGHMILLDKANKKIEIKTAGGHTVLMDDQGKKVLIKTTNGHSCAIDDNPPGKIALDTSGDVQIKAGMNLKLEAGINVDIKAGAQVNVKGAMINLN
jgi:phage protein D